MSWIAQHGKIHVITLDSGDYTPARVIGTLEVYHDIDEWDSGTFTIGGIELDAFEVFRFEGPWPIIEMGDDHIFCDASTRNIHNRKADTKLARVFLHPFASPSFHTSEYLRVGSRYFKIVSYGQIAEVSNPATLFFSRDDGRYFDNDEYDADYYEIESPEAVAFV